MAQWSRMYLQCRRCGFDPWVRKIPCRRAWQPTPVFLPGESHGQSSLEGYSPWGHKESDMTEQLKNKILLLFNCSVMSNSLQPHGLQHIRLSCPSPPPGACWNLGPLSRWCHPTISSSIVPFSSWLQSFPASGSFLMSWLFNQMAKVLELQLQHQSCQWIFRTDFL